jgi:ATP adenylyltransferase
LQLGVAFHKVAQVARQVNDGPGGGRLLEEGQLKHGIFREVTGGQIAREDTLLPMDCQPFQDRGLFATIDRVDHLWSPWRKEYIEGPKIETGCIFCWAAAQPDSPDNLIIFRGQRAFLILNRYPYTNGHMMSVPFEHQPSIELLSAETRAEMMELATRAVQALRASYHPEGLNLGINIGEAAGAGITGHVHLHILPRWAGDTNFMSSVGNTRVLPETLEDAYQRLKAALEAA